MKYFTLQELTRSATAQALGIKNTPTLLEVRALTALVDNVLDPARAALGAPVNVTSGYRCKRLNKAVGGARNSQHLKGQAADITCKYNPYLNGYLFQIIRNQGNFDQLIWERGNGENPEWIHVSYNNNGKNRKEVLRTKDGKTYYAI